MNTDFLVALARANGKTLTIADCQKIFECGFCVIYKNGRVIFFEE